MIKKNWPVFVVEVLFVGLAVWFSLGNTVTFFQEMGINVHFI